MKNRNVKHVLPITARNNDVYDGLWRLPRKKEWFAVIIPFICCCISLILLNCQSDEPYFLPMSTQWSMDDSVEMKIGHSGQSLTTRVPTNFVYEYGYAMCVGDESSMITDALFTIKRFRSHWKSTYPLMVAHCSELSKSNIHAMTEAHEDSVGELVDKEGRVPELHIIDLCTGAIPAKKKRLRSWFCKTAALVTSRYRNTMLIDTDLIWLHNPDFLFDAPGYVKTGALFFRDRYITQPLYAPSSTGWALQYKPTVELINQQRSTSPSNSLGPIIGLEVGVGTELGSIDVITAAANQAKAKALANNNGNGINYFWRYGYDTSLDGGLAHNQESSVVMIDKHRNHRTITEISRLIPTFNLGYGDKEIYWIAASIAGDEHAWEPYLQGLYGDCGEILHFNPNVELSTATTTKIHTHTQASVPYFVNGQFLVEGVHVIGEGVKTEHTKPILAEIDTLLKGCSCESMGGCIQAMDSIKHYVELQQAFMLEHTGQPPSKLSNQFKRLMKRIYGKFLPSWLS